MEIAFDSDGFWHPTTNGFTQTLTSGNYYIFIGIPINTYQMPIDVFHPVFYYDGTKLIDADKYWIDNLIPADMITGSGTTGSIAKFVGPNEIGDATVSSGSVNSTTATVSEGILTISATPTTVVTGIT